MNKASVLIVEDNRDILDSLRLLLEHEGFKVITAQDCFTAFDYLTLSRPNVILTDLMIPEMTGLEFIRWVRRVSEFDAIPIIAMSAYDKNYLAAAIMAGATAALHKPEDLDVLVETIHQALAGTDRQEVA